MTYPFVVAVGDEGPTSEYVVEIDQDLPYTFMLTDSDAQAIEDQTNVPIAPITPPELTSLAPDTAEVGAAVVTVTATGTGFAEGAQVLVGGSAVAATRVSETSMTFDIDPTSATAGPVSVVVSNVVAVSGPLVFTFTEPPAP